MLGERRPSLRSPVVCNTLVLALAAAALLAGCGGDDGTGGPGPEEPDECTLSVTLSGAVSETLDYGAGDGCSGSSTDVYTALSWGGLGDAPSFGVFISGSTSQPVAALAARAVIVSTDAEATWETPSTCLVDITASEIIEETSLGTRYAIEGNGTCADPAVDASEAQDDVQVGAFGFTARTLSE